MAFQPRMSAAELAFVAKLIHTFDDPQACGIVDADGMASIREDLARHVAVQLAKVNSYFDAERFMRAATTGVNKATPRPIYATVRDLDAAGL